MEPATRELTPIGVSQTTCRIWKRWWCQPSDQSVIPSVRRCDIGWIQEEAGPGAGPRVHSDKKISYVLQGNVAHKQVCIRHAGRPG